MGNASVRNRSLRIALVILVIVAIIGTAISSYYWYAPSTRMVDGIVAIRSLPKELQNVTFVRVSESGSERLNINGFRFVKASEDTHGLSISPNGSKVTYAIPSKKDASDFSKWNIVLRESGGARMLANGYAPHFLTDTKILYFAQGGIVVHNLETQKSDFIMFVPDKNVNWIGAPVTYSKDGSFVLWKHKVSNEYVLGSISENSYQPLGTFISLNSPVLVGDAIYDTRTTSQGTEVWVYRVNSAPELVTVLPSSLSINTLLP